MKKIIILFAGITLTMGVFAQSGKLKKADKFYTKVAYAEALPLYTDLLGSRVDSPKMQAKLADCYYQMGETVKSEELYSEMITTSEATSEDVYNYAQSLKENGKYAESDKWMTKFHLKETQDSRGKQFSKNKAYVQKIESQEVYFSMNHLGVNTASTDFGGYPMGEGKAYFISNRKKKVVRRLHTWNDKRFLDIYQATIDSTNELEDVDFQPRKVNKKFHEGPLCVSSDGKTVYFTRSNMSGGKNRRSDKGIQCLKMFVAEINEKGKWVNEKEIEINSKEYSTGHPSLSSDGKTLYFVSDMPGGFGGADIYKMTVNEDGTYGKPENLGAKINTEGQEMFPWINSKGMLLFSSDGHLGLGGLDVFAMLPNFDGSFDKLINVGKPINSSKDDFAMIMNPDNTTGYVSSNRESGSGDDDIYSFTLLKPLKVNYSLKGVVANLRSNEVIPDATVNLLDENGDIIATTTANDKGEYEFELEPEVKYTVQALKDGYFNSEKNASTDELADGEEKLEKNVSLEKDPGLSLYAVVTDAKTKNPLEDVRMIFTDNLTGEQVEIITTEKGDYFRPLTDKKLDDNGSYKFSLSKEGYIPKEVTFNPVFDKEGQYDVHTALDLTMDEIVEDLTELVEINPINFDLNKAVIRPDAEMELDKIVDVMNKYPLMEIELGSHTDCRASRAYNKKLSDRRAKASAAYIKANISNPERIHGKGYGESRLLNDCGCEGSVKSDCSEKEHEENRRTEFKVISIGDPNVDVKNNSTDSFDKK